MELEHAPDHHAVLVLQPAVEAFFLVHSPQQGSVAYKGAEKEASNATAEGGEQQNPPEAAPAPATSGDRLGERLWFNIAEVITSVSLSV